MPDIAWMERFLSWGSLVLSVLLLATTWVRGLHRVYRWFFALFSFDVVITLVGMSLDRFTSAFTYFYIGSAVILWAGYFLVLREIYELVLAEHPGIASFGRKVLYGGTIGALAISAVVILMQPPANSPVSRILIAFRTAHSATMLALLLLLLAIVAFLLFFPVRLRRNIVVYCIGFAVFFLSKAVLLFGAKWFNESQTIVVSTANVLLANGVLAYWVLYLNREGQATEVALASRWRPQETARLVSQLEAINAALLRGGRPE